MKVIIKNSSVEFRNYEPLLDVEVTFNSASWQYIELNGEVGLQETTSTIALIPTGTTLTSLQVKPYVNGAVASAPVFLLGQYNEANTVTNYSGNVITQIGVFCRADTFPVTFRIVMEKQ